MKDGRGVTCFVDIGFTLVVFMGFFEVGFRLKEWGE